MTPGGPHSGEQGGLADPDPLSRLFAGPTDEDRARLRADLLARAGQVRANGWEPYRGLWSTGEVIGVALLLAAHAELAALGETLQSAWERWAFDLWGLDGGQSDVDNRCERTRDWFLDAAYELAGGETVGDRSDGPSGKGISMSEMLGADSGHDIDFEPKGLGDLGPVVPEELPPRSFGQHADLQVPETFDEPLPFEELVDKVGDLESNDD